jgi:hypothetical protein
MNPQDNLIRNTTWTAILLIIFGVLFKVIESNFITWFLFAFLCVIGFFDFVDRLGDRKRFRDEKKDRP